jgi:hypothetical protein
MRSHAIRNPHLDTDRKPMKRPHRLAVPFQVVIKKPSPLKGLVEEDLRQTVCLYEPEIELELFHPYH